MVINMEQYLDFAQQQLLTPVGMEVSDLHRTLGQLGNRNIDQADLYFESSRSESWVLEEGIIKEGSHDIQQGVGVRAISGDKTGFAYSDEILLPSLDKAAKAARAIASSGSSSTNCGRAPPGSGICGCGVAPYALRRNRARVAR